jgi:hypothetical protein
MDAWCTDKRCVTKIPPLALTRLIDVNAGPL